MRTARHSPGRADLLASTRIMVFGCSPRGRMDTTFVHVKRSVVAGALCAVAAFVLAVPTALSADNTSVTNTVRIEASTGGNESGDGDVETGTTTNSISVETTVNGEVVERYSDTSTSPIDYQHSYRTGTTQVRTEARTGSSPRSSEQAEQRALPAVSQNGEAQPQATSAGAETGATSSFAADRTMDAPLSVLARVWDTVLGFISSLLAYVQT